MLAVLPPSFVADPKIIYGYNFVAPLTLIRLGFLKVVFPGGCQFDPPFIFQEELIQLQ